MAISSCVGFRLLYSNTFRSWMQRPAEFFMEALFSAFCRISSFILHFFASLYGHPAFFLRISIHF